MIFFGWRLRKSSILNAKLRKWSKMGTNAPGTAVVVIALLSTRQRAKRMSSWHKRGQWGFQKEYITSDAMRKSLEHFRCCKYFIFVEFHFISTAAGQVSCQFSTCKDLFILTFSDQWISVFSRSSVVFVGSFCRRLSTRFCVSSCMVSRAQKKKSWVFWCLFVSLLSLQSGSKYVNPLHFIQIYVFLKKSQLNATQFKMADSPPGYLITYSILSTTTDFWVRWIFPNFPL